MCNECDMLIGMNEHIHSLHVTFIHHGMNEYAMLNVLHFNKNLGKILLESLPKIK